MPANRNRSQAAKLLGVSRATFYRRLTALGLPALALGDEMEAQEASVEEGPGPEGRGAL